MTWMRWIVGGILLWSVASGVSANHPMGGPFDDVAALRASREGLQQTIEFLDAYPELLRIPKGTVPTKENRAALLGAWHNFLDHVLALDVIGERNNRRYHEGSGADKDLAFQISFAAFLTEYRYALAFLQRTEQSDAIHLILNEAIPELGLPEGTYAKTKFRFLNVLRAADFSRLSVMYRLVEKPSSLASLIEEDSDYLLELSEHDGALLTVKNGGQIVKDALFTTWFPVQRGVSEWMGDTKVVRRGVSLISSKQLRDLQPALEPGDVLLVRREWYLSNVGLPGFWPHAALYIGTESERRAYFDDAQVREWVKAQGETSGDFENLLASTGADKYRSSALASDGEPVRILEAISEGVSFTSLDHAGGGDSMVVLRPRLDKIAKARAIARAFHLSGRPYDFDFNFLTDSSLVCTELIYKAYEGEGGLALPLETVMGRPVLAANRIAILFDEEYDKPSRQMDFVAFLDGHEDERRAVTADVHAFRASWRRPKWHIFTQTLANE